MYGYLRLISGITPPSIQRYYRSRYCTLCHALWNNYGMLSRFILSYDMTFLAVILALDNHVDIGNRLLCYKRNHFTEDDSWKRLSAMSVLLATKKLQDDIDDENSMIARIGLLLFRRAANKAESDYPNLAEIFTCGFREMSVMEKEEKDIFAMSDRFGKIITDAVSSVFSCKVEDIAVIRHVTRWVYFIDALDDLDDDSRDGSFNPLKKYASTKNDLLSRNSEYLELFISKQMKDFESVLKLYKEGSAINWIIMSTLTETLPIVTERVLNGEKPFRRTLVVTQLLQSKGGYRFA